MPRGPDDVVIQTTASDPAYLALMWVCVGCGDAHACQVRGTRQNALWTWNDSLSAPTLAPSVLKMAPGKRCHSFVRDGVVEFLSDCAHPLAGQKVRMLPENADPFGRPWDGEDPLAE